ncbi:MAG: hypothetical protein KKA73_07680, partial [Chloroflexi bacterium]|nr:hypothetical protein [Chloroflexota bacterium]
SIREQQAQITVQEPLPLVLGHHTTLTQVVANLLANAIKFVAPGVQPQVRVWAEAVERVVERAVERVSGEADEWVRLWVEDNGIGIAPEYHEHIFGLMKRLHGAETYPGTGVGLAIVRKGVAHMGGRVGVESEPGQGSRFWIELRKA